MEIGVITVLRADAKGFDHVSQFGLHVCQLFCGDRSLATPEMAATVRQESAATGVRVCAVWAGLPGPAEWNFTRGPVTLGLVPPESRPGRVAAVEKGGGVAA